MSVAQHYSMVDPVRQHLRPDMSSEIEDMLVEMYRHTKIFASVLFPEHFYREFDAPYDEVFDAFDDPSIMKAVFCGPRGIGKTGLANLVLPAKKILFRESHYIVPLSATSDMAIEQARNLKDELKNNENIAKLFPGLEFDMDSEKLWSVNWRSTITGEIEYSTCVRPRGAGQQVRGQKFKMYRPTTLIPDDLEKSEETLSDEQRDKLKRWFWSDLVNSVDRSRTDWKIFYLGTILHEDALLVELMEKDDWLTIVLPLCDDEFNSNFPNYIPTESVVQEDGTILQGTIELAETFRNDGRIDTFYMEYMCEIQSTQDTLFQPHMFKYAGPEEKESDGDICTTIEDLVRSPYTEAWVLLDPAKTVTKYSAETGIVGGFIDHKRHCLFVADIVHGKMHPNEIYDALFDMAAHLKSRVIGVEVTSLNEFIIYPLKNEMARRGINLEIVELQARGGHSEGKGEGKLRRIAALGPFYRRGEVYHFRPVCNVLEKQLLGFPRSKKKDVMDALAYIVQLLEKGLRYFFHDWFDDESTYAEEGPGIEKEYEDLVDIDDEPFEYPDMIGGLYD